MEPIRKILGLILLLLGLLVIFYGLYSSYNIFTAKTPAPEIFETETSVSAQKSGTFDIQAQLQEAISNQLKGLLPVNSLSTILNLAAWSIFAGILIFGGAQISSLGIKLIK